MLTVEVDIGAIRQNARFVRAATGVPLCAVVKANAYGHGLVSVAKALSGIADCFAVATYGEAAALVKAGIGENILVLGDTNDAPEIFPANVVPTVTNLSAAAELKGRAKHASVAVNTGMNRIGCEPGGLTEIVETLARVGVGAHGVYTHFYNEKSQKCCADQFDAFLSAMLPLRRRIRRFHCCASNCLVLPGVYRLDLVRAGLALYGYGYEGVRPATRIYTDVLEVRDAAAGEHVGYGDYVLQADARIATLRIGYGDGLRRGERYDFMIGGELCRTVGSICMDMCMVEVKKSRPKVGERAFLLGNGIEMADFCKNHSTMPHEVLTTINERAVRIYVERG